MLANPKVTSNMDPRTAQQLLSQTYYIGPPQPTDNGSGMPGTRRLSEAEAIAGLKRLGRIVLALSLAFLINAIFGVVSLLFIQLTVTSWFSDFHTYFVAIAVILGVALWPFSFWAFKRNIIGSTYGFFFGVVGVIIIAFLALVIWALVEWFLFCPTDMPDICTNTMDSTIERGWMFFVIYSIIELVLFALSFAVMYSVRRYYKTLVSNFAGMDEAAVIKLIYDAMFGSAPSYVTGIGMKPVYGA